MMITIFLLTFFSFNSNAGNRPYNDVVREFVKDKCTQKKENIYLSKKDRAEIEKRSGTKLYGGLALRYVTSCPNKEDSYHYVDSHIVRTLNETVVLTIDDNKVKSFIVSSFNEPREYIAPKKWYQQFNGKDGSKILRAREQIDALSGATLTVTASISAVNKTLALHNYLKKETK